MALLTTIRMLLALAFCVALPVDRNPPGLRSSMCPSVIPTHMSHHLGPAVWEAKACLGPRCPCLTDSHCGCEWLWILGRPVQAIATTISLALACGLRSPTTSCVLVCFLPRDAPLPFPASCWCSAHKRRDV